MFPDQISTDHSKATVYSLKVSWVRTCIHLAGYERDSRPGTSDRFSNPATPSWSSEVKRPGCPASTSELEPASHRLNKTNLNFQRSRRRGADRSSKHHLQQRIKDGIHIGDDDLMQLAKEGKAAILVGRTAQIIGALALVVIAWQLTFG